MRHSDSLIIDRLGGNASVAGICKVSSQAVSKWRNDGIPEARLMYLRLAFPDAFTATVNAEISPIPENREAA